MRFQSLKRSMGVVALLVGCIAMSSWVAESATAASEAPTVSKKPSSLRSEAALSADAKFWDVFSNGKYEQIEEALTPLTGAYLRDPHDTITASHIAWLHIWRISERERMAKISPLITDEAILARRYFQEAYELNPSDARVLGFLAATTLSEGTIHHNEHEIRQGTDLLHQSITMWPEFNLFTAGYMMSSKPADSAEFAQALSWQWENLDLCAGSKVSRTDPDYSNALSKIVTTGPKRVCWNSTIAPHNFEGFFLNMGDMLVKSGDWQTAQKIYASAKLSPQYSEWKFAPILEERITKAQANVEPFRANKGLMAGTRYSCMGCHQR